MGKGQAPPARKVRVTAHVPLVDIEPVVDPPVCDVRVTRAGADPNRFDMLITPKATLPPGRFDGHLRVWVVTEQQTRLHGASIQITGEVQPDIRVMPASLFLPSTPLGQTAEAVVILQASGENTVLIDHWEADSPDTTVLSLDEAALPGERVFRVLQKVTEEGDQRGQVRFIIRKPDKTYETVTTEVYCRGERAAAR